MMKHDAEEFRERGAVCLRQLVDAAWLDVLAEGLEKNLADPSPYGCRYTDPSSPGGFVDDYCNWQRFSEYRDFVVESGIGEKVGELLGSSSVRFFHEHVLVKEPGTREISPWHQDQPYYCVDGEQVCSVWLPLDPVPISVCPEYVAGSHRWGKMFTPLKFMDHRPYDGSFDAFEPLPDIEAHRHDYEILSWELQPGDAIAFHMKTVHGAPGTAALKTRRRAIATRWLGDDAVFAKRPFEPSPPFPEVSLEPGAPMVHASFPVVFSKTNARR
jgi:ectoine hydroxylase-related dioxygenase (phytanoyl-CoA dioxygenase family)